MARKGCTKVIYKGTFVLKQSLNSIHMRNKLCEYIKLTGSETMVSE